MATKKNGKKNILSKLQLAYISCWEGDNTEAARTAGYANPKQAGAKLMQTPAVRKAIEEKQQQVIKTAGKQLGKKLAKSDIADSILEAIDMVKGASKKIATKKTVRTDDVNSLTRACDSLVKANMALAELQGFIFKKSINYDRLLDDLTDEELELVYRGNLPNMGGGQSAPNGSKSPGCAPDKPETK
jgi:hypothetical protein